MEIVLETVCCLCIGIIVCLILSFLYWLFGLILYQFKFSKIIGFRMLCMSGLFPKLLPQLCPCPTCNGTPCGMWTCPRYSVDNKKTGHS